VGVISVRVGKWFTRRGISALTKGIEIIAADSPGAFVENTPTATLIHQVLGVVASFRHVGRSARS
jgi:hypothetical protein